MDELLGSHIEEELFERYLEDWPEILEDRAATAAAAIAGVPGVQGLLLAGSLGVGKPWPLSDIDLIPIYSHENLEAARNNVERARLQLLRSWSGEGWRTGIDIGRLHFTQQELENSFAECDPDPVVQSKDDRWYYSLDKGYHSRVVLDCGGYAQRLTSWITSHRFRDDVVASRVDRSGRECWENLDLMRQALDNGDRVLAYSSFLKSIQWFQVHHMEKWRARDNSQGRFGTRFEILANQKGFGDVVSDLNRLASLTESEVYERVSGSPWWVKERRDRSWRSRMVVNETVSKLQNDRDVLRVCATYQLRLEKSPPFEDWIAIPNANELDCRGTALENILGEFISKPADS